MGIKGEVVPILQYADDTIIFMDTDLRIEETLRVLLTWFEVVSDLHVNVHKTKVYRIVGVDNWIEVLNLWGCTEGCLPDIYLGLPLDICSSSRRRSGKISLISIMKGSHNENVGISPKQVNWFWLNQPSYQS